MWLKESELVLETHEQEWLDKYLKVIVQRVWSYGSRYTLPRRVDSNCEG